MGENSQYYRPSRLEQPRLDNFNAPDGFNPSQSTGLPTPNQHHKATEISFSSGQQPRVSGMSAPQEIGSLAAPQTKLRSLRPHEEPVKTARKKHKRTHKRSWLKIALKTSGVLVVVVVLIGGFLFAKGYNKLNKVLKGGGSAAALSDNVDPNRLRGEGDGRVNVLMLGRGGDGHTAPDLTDTILIASIDPVQKEAALLSVPRDMYVKSPSGSSSKINAVYANAKYAVLNRASKKTPEVADQAEKAGIEAIEAVVSRDMGIPIHYYVMVDFSAFRQAIDAVGGIDINVKTQLYDTNVAWENKGNPLIAKVGPNHMNGKLALLYARSRMGSARGDFDRTERQREILLALKSKVLSTGTFANPIKISQLIDAFGDHVSTDLGMNDVSRLYDISKEIGGDKVRSLGLADPPNNFVTTDNIGGSSIVRPRKGLYDFSEIQAFVRNELKDSFLKSENARVIVLNGTETAGLATKTGDILKSYGYNVTKVDSAPTTDYTKTTLIDLSNGTKKYTRNYLEKRLNITAKTTMPDSTIDVTTADFVIILGSNETASN